MTASGPGGAAGGPARDRAPERAPDHAPDHVSDHARERAAGPASASRRMSRAILPLALTLSSAGSMALEILAGRLLAPYLGMSLYSWTAIIAVVLGGLAAGHWLGGVRADRARRPATEAALALGLAGLTAALAPALLDLWGRVAAQGLDPLAAIGLLSLALFFPPSFAVGVVSPILTKLALDRAEPARRGHVLGRMYALGAFGAILGTLIAGYVLVSWLGTHASMLLVAGLYAVLAAALALIAERPGDGPRALGAAALALLGLGGALGLAAAGPCDRESSYYCIQVDALSGGAVRVLALDHLGHGLNDAEDPTRIHAPYVAIVDEIVARRLETHGAPAAFSAFFIGGGAFTLPRAWLARFPQARLVTAEIDPEVTATAHEALFLPRSPNHRIVALDARLALQRESGRFDVIFGDAFHDISIPQHLVTDEFHALVKRKLAPGGLYVINVVEAMRRPPFLASLAGTLQRRFAYVTLWLSTGDFGPEEKRITWVVAASDDPRVITAPQIDARDGSGRTWLRAPTDAMIALVPAAERAFLTDDYTPVDRLMRHILLDRRLAEN